MDANPGVFERGTKASDVPPPFAEMQLRPFDQPEAGKILAAIEGLAGVVREPIAIGALLRAVAAAESALPNVNLKLEPYLMKSPVGCVSFRVVYEGHTNVKVLDT